MSETLKKTHDKSHFRHFHYNSPLAKALFASDSDTVILQIMKVDPEHYLAELVKKKDK